MNSLSLGGVNKILNIEFTKKQQKKTLYLLLWHWLVGQEFVISTREEDALQWWKWNHGSQARVLIPQRIEGKDTWRSLQEQTNPSYKKNILSDWFGRVVIVNLGIASNTPKDSKEKQ